MSRLREKMIRSMCVFVLVAAKVVASQGRKFVKLRKRRMDIKWQGISLFSLCFPSGEGDASMAKLPYHLLPTPIVHWAPQNWQGIHPGRTTTVARQPWFLPNSVTFSRPLLQTFLSSVNEAYQELVKRQQAFINLINCGDCITSANPVNNGWQTILSSMMGVPNLQWMFRPSVPDPSDSSSSMFFAATNNNGVVSGVGGSFVDSKPVVEFTFGNNEEIRPNSEKV